MSVFGTTGTKEPELEKVKNNILQVKKQTSLKIAVGFGIKSGSQIAELKKAADLIVIGSAYCQIIEKHLNDKNNMLLQLEEFNKEITKFFFA